MDFQRKLDIAKRSIESISKADDQDSAIRTATLDALDAFIISERDALQARLTAKIGATFATAKE